MSELSEEQMKKLFQMPDAAGWTDALVEAVNAATAENRAKMPVTTAMALPANKVSYAQACKSHHIRKWDAVGRSLVCGLLAVGTYAGMEAGWIPDAAAAVLASVLTGYTIWMATIVVQEVKWYHKNVMQRKKAKA